MKLFLTSSVNFAAKSIAEQMDVKANSKLAFIYTAAEVEEGGRTAPWCDEDRQSLVNIGFEVTDYTITDKSKSELKQELSLYDVIYVSGGNTFYLLQQSQKSGFVEVIRDLVMKQNKIYIGTSAGSVIVAPSIEPTKRIDTESIAPDIKGYAGFNLVNFCVFPHWGSEFFKELYLNRRLDFAYKSD